MTYPRHPQQHDFRDRYFPDASNDDWEDWRWQIRKRFQDSDSFSTFLELADDEREGFHGNPKGFPFGITPYYASLIDPADPDDPLRKTMVPRTAEHRVSEGEYIDPLAEDRNSPVPGIVHRYPDRVLFLITDFCPVYCRYCTRSRMVGGNAPFKMNQAQWQAGIDYIANTPEVRDVLVSGGDPLVCDDDKLDWILSRLRQIPHVDIIRLGTKIPAVLPQRITPAFCDMLKRHQPIYMSVHLTHPNECTPEFREACNRLADSGVPLFSQTVLLAGVNDSVETIRELMHNCLKLRIRPYYLLQCDAIHGSAHFKTPLKTGVDIIHGLRGHTSGYAVPHFIVDVPDGGGKISLDPEYIVGKDGDDWLITNYLGEDHYRYRD